MSEHDDELDDLEARMRKALNVPDHAEKAEETKIKSAVEKVPLPKRVFLERIDATGEGHDISSYDERIRWRWFFHADDGTGQRKPLFNTTSEKFAKKEVERFKSLGIPVEALKERKI